MAADNYINLVSELEAIVSAQNKIASSGELNEIVEALCSSLSREWLLNGLSCFWHVMGKLNLQRRQPGTPIVLEYNSPQLFPSRRNSRTQCCVSLYDWKKE